MKVSDLREQGGGPVFICMSQVWGEEYSIFFAKYVLPSFLSQGNLACEGLFCFEFNLFITKEDWERVKSYPSMVYLDKITELRVRFIEIGDNNHTFDVMNECQEIIAFESQKRDLPAIYLQPDAILSDGCIRGIVNHWKNGIRCILVPGVRASKETFIPNLYKENLISDGVVALTPREIVDALIDNLHDISHSLCIDSEFFSNHPSHVYFVEKGKGMAAVCAHVHPLMVHATSKTDFGGSTLDDVYVHRAVSDKNLIHAVYDSDECIVIEISSSEKNFGEYTAQNFDWAAYIGWLWRFTSRTQRHFMLKPYFLQL